MHLETALLGPRRPGRFWLMDVAAQILFRTRGSPHGTRGLRPRLAVLVCMPHPSLLRRFHGAPINKVSARESATLSGESIRKGVQIRAPRGCIRTAGATKTGHQGGASRQRVHHEGPRDPKFIVLKTFLKNSASGPDFGWITCRMSAQIGLPAGHRPAGGPVLALTQQKSDQNPARKHYLSENLLKIKDFEPLGVFWMPRAGLRNDQWG